MKKARSGFSKGLIAGAIALSFGLFAAACSDDSSSDTSTTASESTETTAPVEETPQMGGTLNVGLESAISTLDPIAALAQPADHDVALTIYDKLVSFDDEGNFAPYLAKSVTASDDLMTWTVVLNEGVSFHDGTPLNADAVVAHWARMIDPASKSNWAKTATEHGLPVAQDDLTVVWTIAKPYVAFINDIAGTMGYIPSPTAVAADGANFGLNPVGSGPFMVETFEAGGRVVVKKNPNYWKTDDAGNTLPYLDGINFLPIPDSAGRLQALSAGDIDLMQTADTSTVVAAEEKNFAVQKVSGSSSTVIFFNTKAEPTNDVRVRQALAYATNRQEMNDVGYKSARQISLSAFAPSSPYFNPDAQQPAYDPAKAKALLEEYGKPVNIVLECISTPEADLLLQVVKENWEAVGVTVTLKTQEQGAYVARMFSKKGDYQAACFRTGQFIEPDQWRSTVGTDEGSNLTFYSNAEVDALLAEGASTADFETRKAAYFAAAKIVAEEVPAVTTLYDLFGNIYNGDKVAGLPTPEGNALGAIKLAYVFIKS